jgi:hypothetical protein
VPVQWVHLGAGKILVASSRGAWIQLPELGPLGLGALGLGDAMPSAIPGTLETTRNLLDGAIAAAERAVPAPKAPPMTARRWAWQLVNQWFIARYSVALLAEAAERYVAVGRPDLARFTRQRHEEERGHDQFPLKDLRALGYDAEEVVGELPPATAATALIDYARNCARGEHPVEFLGYIHAMERHVLRLSPAWFATVEEVLPSGVDATSGLRAHATDLDVEHVEEAVLFFSGLPAEDRTMIALACYQTTTIRNLASADAGPSDAELERSLSPLRLGPLTSAERSNRKHKGASP